MVYPLKKQPAYTGYGAAGSAKAPQDGWGKAKPDGDEKPLVSKGFGSTTYHTVAFAGEGPTQIAERASRELGVEVPWGLIVTSNPQYFRDIKDKFDRFSEAYRYNSQLRPGDPISFTLITDRLTATPSQAIDLTPASYLTVDVPGTDQDPQILVEGKVAGFAMVALVFGIESDAFDATLSLAFKGELNSTFLIDADDNTPLLQDKEGSISLIAGAMVGVEFYKYKYVTGVSAAYNFTKKNWEFVYGKSFSKGIGEQKTGLGSQDMAYELSPFSAKYDRAKKCTEIEISVKFSDQFEGIIPINGLCRLKVSVGGEATISFKIQIPGRQEQYLDKPVDPTSIYRGGKPFLD